MLPVKIKQPLERLEKMVLVSIYEGKRLLGWRLVKARKTGNEYRIPHDSRCK